MNDINRNQNSLDDFSLDLETLGKELTNPSNSLDINLDDFNLDELMSPDTTQTSLSASENQNVTVNLDDMNVETTINSPSSDATPQPDSVFAGEIVTDNPAKSLADDVDDIPLDKLVAPVAVGAVAGGLNQDTKPEKKSLFSQQEKPKKSMSRSNAKKSGNKPNQNIIYALLALVVLGGLAWFMMTSKNEEPVPEPTVVTAPVAEATPVVAETASVASSTETTPASSVASVATVIVASVPTDTSVETASTPAISTTKPVVTAEEILSAEKPKDPAIAQEELDRLAEQATQLADQEKMIEEQLRMMNELSSKKEERIKLLEQQIAQLEQQKAQEKMEKSK